jgi:putative ABC transport system permease protein
MTFLNYLRQFLRDVRSQKLRTFLTVFGIIWGTTAVTLLLAFGEGFHKQVVISQRGLGDQIVIAWPAQTSKSFNGLPRGRPVRVTQEDVDTIRQEVPELARITGEYGDGSRKFKVGRKVIVPHMVGADPQFAVMRNLIPDDGGRYVNPLDMDKRKRVVFLGNQLKEDLFGIDEAVGGYVQISGVPFLVVGVMQQKEQDSSYQGRDKDSASIPWSTFEAMFGRRYVDNLVFQAADPDDTEQVKEQVIATLARKYRFDPSDDEAVIMWDTTEGFRFINAFFLGFRIFLGIVGGLTLVVGGIGVSNIMNVVVEERTKEIGIKMALGARRRYVIGQFLFETLLITLAGGAIGFAISWGLCAAFPALGAEEFVGTPRISLSVAASTTAILGLIGFLAGYFPARSAAGLNPVESLRL